MEEYEQPKTEQQERATVKFGTGWLVACSFHQNPQPYG